MTIKQLREWAFANGKDDVWLMRIGGVDAAAPVTLAELESQLAAKGAKKVTALHASQAVAVSPLWIELDIEAAPAASHVASEAIAQVALLVPLIGVLLIWFWVASMNMLERPGSALNAIALGTIGLTAVLIAVDAQALGLGRRAGQGGVTSSGPLAWAVLVLLLWVIGFPAYMYRRAAFGGRNMFVGALVLTVLFVGSLFFMGSAIAEKQEELRQILQRW